MYLTPTVRQGVASMRQMANYPVIKGFTNKGGVSAVANCGFTLYVSADQTCMYHYTPPGTPSRLHIHPCPATRWSEQC